MSLETARRVLRIEAQAIQDVLTRLDATFQKAVDLLFGCKGRVVVTGMGKSGLIGRKISATFSSTGTPSFFLHPPKLCTATWGCSRAATPCWRFPMAARRKRSYGCWKR